jgi:sec-independent protein translocase protein TatB
MFDLGWSEMLLIGVVALIVVGPKELPGLFRQIGIFMGKARGIAREFTRAMEAAADESGMKEIDRTIRAAANPVKFGAGSLRDAALGKGPTAGTPLNPGAPVVAGGATGALAAERAAEGERLRAEAAQRSMERAVAGATAPGVMPAAAPVPEAAPATTSTDGTA